MRVLTAVRCSWNLGDFYVLASAGGCDVAPSNEGFSWVQGNLKSATHKIKTAARPNKKCLSTTRSSFSVQRNLKPEICVFHSRCISVRLFQDINLSTTFRCREQCFEGIHRHSSPALHDLHLWRASCSLFSCDSLWDWLYISMWLTKLSSARACVPLDLFIELYSESDPRRLVLGCITLLA